MTRISGQLEKGHPIMGTTFTPGQVSKLQNDVNIAVATALPKVVGKLDPKVVLRALEGRGEIFAGHIETALEQAIGRMLVLMRKGATTVILNEQHDPDAFYRTRAGLYVWDDYRTRIVASAKPVEPGFTVKSENFELMQDASDVEIEAALPKEHLFDETQVCVLVAELIAKQPNGESRGPLITNGRANLFYTVSCVVHVYWSAVDREWCVHTYLRDDDRWGAGLQGFSPAN